METLGSRRALLGMGGVLLCLLSAADASAWWNTTWSHRRKLTFDNSGSAGEPRQLPRPRRPEQLPHRLQQDARTAASTCASSTPTTRRCSPTRSRSGTRRATPTSGCACRRSTPRRTPTSSGCTTATPPPPRRRTFARRLEPGLPDGPPPRRDRAGGTHVDSATNDGNATRRDRRPGAGEPATGMIDGADSFVRREQRQRRRAGLRPRSTWRRGTPSRSRRGARRMPASYQMAYSKESRGNPGDGEFQLWSDNGTASFWLNDGAGNTARAGSAATSPTTRGTTWSGAGTRRAGSPRSSSTGST